ncbi:acetate/propionate family kinase [Acholeplasma hippikon]|uniref:Acetate kinase n=1 Tax=Acholeplasma hippikon TaxID=264636 RepID=A0A449BJR8_9MOLU|nr:acetate kinase [Acholeplasma hippikon]VEU82711.1 acetate kinase [Acholeplasma hippikon]
MKVIAVNAGSSSLKFQLLQMPEEIELASGIVERIGKSDAIFQMKFNGEKHKLVLEILNHKDAADIVIKNLLDYGVIKDLKEINGVGHRIVQGGETFKDSVLVTDEVIKQISDLSDLAPLHNPANVTGILSFKEVLNEVPHVAVFDTTFHQTMEPINYLYATPYEWYENHKVRKYGFHGTSHQYVSHRAAEILNNPKAKIVVAHIGNGASLSAVKDLKSVNTSMGLTPLDGLPMGTRSGAIDPAILGYIAKKENMSLEEVLEALNKKSGYLGVSGLSNDSRDLEEAIKQGHERAKLAIDLQVKSIVNYIAQYYVELGGLDAICFTAGIGENASDFREQIVEKLAPLGVILDKEANKLRGERLISTPESKVKVFIIPTNEEVMIARDVLRVGFQA